MNRIRIALAVSTAALAGSVGVAAAASHAAPTLVGNVGPDSSLKITLTQGGKAVKSLKAGTYKLVVHDTAHTHNFHLVGPGVDKTTSVGGTGTSTWTLKLKRGAYKYQCDPHAPLMHGSFTVE